MGIYARVQRRIWHSSSFSQLSVGAQRMFLYLLTCPHGNILGLFVLKPGYIMEDLNLTKEQFEKQFSELLGEPFWNRSLTVPKPFRNSSETVNDELNPPLIGVKSGLIRYDPHVKMVFIRGYIKHNPLHNLNQVKAAIKVVDDVPFTTLFQDLKTNIETVSKPLYKPLVERLGKRFRNNVSVSVTVTVTENIKMSGAKNPKNQTLKKPTQKLNVGLKLNSESEKIFTEFIRLVRLESVAGLKTPAVNNIRAWLSDKGESYKPSDLLAAVRNYAKTRSGKDPRYTVRPANFFGRRGEKRGYFKDYLPENFKESAPGGKLAVIGGNPGPPIIKGRDAVPVYTDDNGNPLPHEECVKRHEAWLAKRQSLGQENTGTNLSKKAD